MSGAFLSNSEQDTILSTVIKHLYSVKKKICLCMFFKKKKWLYRPVWDCNALSGLIYTGNVCILAYFIFSKMLNAFEIL